MSELLVCVMDRPEAADPAISAMQSGRGDVIVIMPDGHEWSKRERTHEGWRILKLPLVSESEASVFLAPGRSGLGSGKLAAFRAFRINFDGMPADTATITPDALDSLKRIRVLPGDPAHIGPDPGVLG